MTYTPSMVMAQVLYDSVLRKSGGTITYDGTTVTGFEYINAYDWRDFSLFQPTPGSHLVIEFASAVAADTLAVWWQNDLATDVVTLEWWDGAAWVSAGTATQTSGLGPIWTDFTSQSSIKWRLTFSGSAKIRQVAFGANLQFPIGQWAGLNPPTMYQGVVIQNVISMNGSIIGRNLRRIEKGGKIDLMLLLPDWVRSIWDPFAKHAATKAFFWRWDPVGHPTEVAFAVADGIEAPTNDSPPPRMKVAMPIKFLT